MNRFALALMPLLAVAQPAAATYCRPVADMLAEYRAEFGETPAMGGISSKNDNRGFIVLTAPDGSWTLLTTDGTNACMADWGVDATTFSKANV
jgi:hypothetical protein